MVARTTGQFLSTGARARYGVLGRAAPHIEFFCVVGAYDSDIPSNRQADYFLATRRQNLGQKGEEFVAKNCECRQCKRPGTLKRLPPNFKCADVVCYFCGWLAQVKTASVVTVDQLPDYVLGAAWGPQKERMAASVYIPLFLVPVGKSPIRNPFSTIP